jgi:mono/diheme cytochrome c family protein
MKRAYLLLTTLAVALLGFQACNKASGDHPGDGYTWDMMYSRAYEPYALNPIMEDSVGALLPVENTVPYTGDPIEGTYDNAMGDVQLPYNYANTIEDYERAGVEVTSPIENSAAHIADGERLYNNLCAICHGAEGNGKGYIVTAGKYKAVPPSYFDPGYIDMPDGKMFHSITYGKNAMGSYAYALNKLERWQIIAYINAMQDAWLEENTEAAVEVAPAEEATITQ